VITGAGTPQLITCLQQLQPEKIEIAAVVSEALPSP